MMTNKQLQKLRDKLPQNYREILSKNLELHPNTIYQVLKGRFYNQKVIDGAISLAEKTEQDKKEAIEKLKNL